MFFLRDSYILRVFRRELQQMFARPLYMYASVFTMLLSCLFFFTVLKKDIPQDVPVAIVDLDNSTISRRFLHEMNTVQTTRIVATPNSYDDAIKLMHEGKIYAFMVLPENFYADLLAFKRPKICFYVNNAYTVGGTNSYKQMLTMANLVSGAFQQEILKKKGKNDVEIQNLIQPIVLDGHMISNPYSSYSIYLLTTLLPGILGIIALMLTVFSIGFELKNSTTHEWLETGGNIFFYAMTGKMLPYLIIYTLLGLMCDVALFFALDFSLSQFHLSQTLNMLLYVLSMQSLGIVCIGVMPVLRDALSLGGIYSMMSFSLSGFTYPVMAMLPAVQAIANLFPLRHYYCIYSSVAFLDTPFHIYAWHYLAYLFFILSPLLVTKRLKEAAIELNYPKK